MDYLGHIHPKIHVSVKLIMPFLRIYSVPQTYFDNASVMH